MTPIRVLIIGAGVGGLAAAIAFRRAGHRVFVFEARGSIAPDVTGGIRLPPNVTKILYSWGYKQRLEKIAGISTAIDIRLMRTGERLGRHVWEDELIRDACGNFMFTLYGDFVHFLHDIADEMGAILSYDCAVTEVDLDKNTVKLENGQTFTGDIIVGADGLGGISRSMFLKNQDQDILFNVYSTTVSQTLIRADPLTADLYDDKQPGLNGSWFGNGCAVLSWPCKHSELALFVYGPPDGEATGWQQQGGRDRMLQILDNAEPRLRKLAEWARDPHVLTVVREIPLQEWYHVDGPLVLVGQAAQPIAPGSVQEVAISFEDGVALGRIFSHLKRLDQIPSFLEAYEDVRRDRHIQAYEKELGDVEFMTLPPEYADNRDAHMREKGKDGRNLLEVSASIEDGPDGSEEWQRIVDLFAYNCEDAADDWWQSEGKIIEAIRGSIVDGPPLQIRVARNIREH